MLVERIKMPDWECAVETINDNFETSGILQTPLVIVHGQYDHIALEWHQAEYIARVAANPPSSNFLSIFRHVTDTAISQLLKLLVS